MEENYIIDFAYRNICFLKFFEHSKANLLIIKNFYQNNQLESQFKNQNEEQLQKYEKEEKIYEDQTKKGILIKKETIKNWAKINKINVSNNLDNNEINKIIDKSIFPQLMSNLMTLKEENNHMINLIYPQIMSNVLSSFNLLIKLKDSFLKQKNEEEDKYTKILKENFKKDKDLEESADEINKLNQQKITLKNRIISLDKSLNIYKQKNNDLMKEIEDLKKNNNENSYGVKNSNKDMPFNEEFYQFEFNRLQNKINELSEKVSSLIKENNDKEIIINELNDKVNSLNIKVSSLQNENNNLKLELENEKKERKNLKEEILELVKQNNLELTKKIEELRK